MIFFRSILFLMMAGLVATTAGCELFEETDIDPFESQDKYFTVYGYLDATRIEQELRVIPVRRTPEVILSPTDRNAFIDASVWSTDLETGTTVQWRHSLEQLENETFGHIFRATLAPRAGRTYRIEIVRADGQSSTATTTIPVLSSISQPVSGSVDRQPGAISQSVVLPGVTWAERLEVLYWMSDGGRGQLRVTRDYSGRGMQDGQGGWTFTLDLTKDANDVRREAEPILGDVLFWNSLEVRARWVDENWPVVEGPIDVDVMAQPGGYTNVENGFGFVGGVGEYVRLWDVDDGTLKADLGFN
ncbi:MAG: hypothetical protein R3178_01585 [Rhodothermales bacterium]|nr:hypothetical protein [Rhodothermales bacterium]